MGAGATVAVIGKVRILVVEDEPLVLRFATTQLQTLGYHVESAEHGPDALRTFGQGKRFDLLFSDVVLPQGMSGVELARQARAILPDLKVLLTSGYSEVVFQLHGRPEPGMKLLRKPYRRRELAEAIHNALGSPDNAFAPSAGQQESQS